VWNTVFIVYRKAFGKKQPGEDAHSAAEVLRREYEKLGPITYVIRMHISVQWLIRCLYFYSSATALLLLSS